MSLSQHHRAKAGYTLDKSPIHHRAEQPFTLTFTPTGNLESPINLPPAYMFLDCGRKPEYPEQTHADTGRTCKLLTETSRILGFELRTFLL